MRTLWIKLTFAAFIASPAFAANPGVIEISEANIAKFNRVIAISDVHGSSKQVKALLAGAGLIKGAEGQNNDDKKTDWKWIGGPTLFIVIGDSIDKGPHSLKVLDFWMHISPQIRAAGGLFIHLLGNHEAEFLDKPKNPKAKEFRVELNGYGLTAEEVASSDSRYGKYLRDMPLAARVGKWLFCHSGHYPTKMSWETFKQEAKSVLSSGNYGNPLLINKKEDTVLMDHEWWKNQPYRKEYKEFLQERLGIYGVVFGHDPGAFNARGEMASKNNCTFIKTDVEILEAKEDDAGRILVFPSPSELATTSIPTITVWDQYGEFPKKTDIECAKAIKAK